MKTKIWADFQICISVPLSLRISEGVTGRCSIKQVLLKSLQNPRETICAKVSFLIKLHERTLFLQNTFCGLLLVYWRTCKTYQHPCSYSENYFGMTKRFLGRREHIQLSNNFHLTRFVLIFVQHFRLKCSYLRS